VTLDRPEPRLEVHGPQQGDPVVRLERWAGPWADDDPDANFKAEVAAYGLADPLQTLRGLSQAVGVPVGALARYVLARWATAGSEGLLQMGGSTVERMWGLCEAAEADGRDEARLAAYHRLRPMLSWLRAPLANGPDESDTGDAGDGGDAQEGG
jgi:hypothetical protein